MGKWVMGKWVMGNSLLPGVPGAPPTSLAFPLVLSLLIVTKRYFSENGVY